MGGTSAFNKTIGNLALELVCPTESPDPEESLTIWERNFGLFNMLRTQEPRTWGSWEQPMRETRTSVESSVNEHRPYSAFSQTMHKKKMADLFPKAVQRLRQFEGLKENWNGDQAPPPSSKTLEHAYDVLGNLWQVACTRKTSPPEPKVTCGAHGDITFSWTLGEKELELGFSIDEGAPKYEYLICLTSGEATCEEGSFEGQLTNSPTFGALFFGL